MLRTMPDTGDRISDEHLAAVARELADLLNGLPLPTLPPSPVRPGGTGAHRTGRVENATPELDRSSG